MTEQIEPYDFSETAKWRADIHTIKVCAAFLSDKRNRLTDKPMKGELSKSFLRGTLEEFMDSTIRRFGFKIVKLVLAYTINSYPCDERFSSEVQAWAAATELYPIVAPDGETTTGVRYLRAKAHPCVVNIAARYAMLLEHENKIERMKR